VPPATDYKNATYIINGTSVKLVNGVSKVPAAPDSSEKIVTKYFGNEVTGDLDGDGTKDMAFLLTQETGGSGTFYYLVAALNTPTGYIGSNGTFLGDRISPQTTEISSSSIITVHYADRKPDESFAIAPSVGKSIRFLFDSKTLQFGEVVKNFEGEADPNVMTLRMHPWQWVRTSYRNGNTVTPRSVNRFALTFTGTSTFSASTDCNGVGGEYTVKGSAITFTRMMSTLMYCEGAQEGDFAQMINDARSYQFTSKGELLFTLSDGSSFIFK
jgi:heat shock protein HslJ